MQRGGKPLARRSHLHRGVATLVVRFALETNAMPQFEIEQSPDEVVIIAMLRAMFIEQLLDRFAAEVSAIQAARFEQHLANRFQSWSGQPPAPRRRKSQLRPVQNRMREQILHRLFE